ncbi:MAG: FIST C-terminal domain-containing protein [bacterium]|nr:FIST C-terminal domain-containing protein [bacterium]
MQIEQQKWQKTTGWTKSTTGKMSGEPQLVLLFGEGALLDDERILTELRKSYPLSHIFGCSTAGEIKGTEVSDETLVASAVHFDHTTLQLTQVAVDEQVSSYEAGRKLAAALNSDELRHVIVLSDGLGVNGSELVKGLTSNLRKDTTVTGGLSGDGDRFKRTVVVMDTPQVPNSVVALGLYGDRLRVGFGSEGGWDSFGPERLVTKSDGNVLYELDGTSVLDLYRKYLGEHADGLPGTGLLFPLSLRGQNGERGIVRTVLAIDEASKSMTFAGDIPEGSFARLMKANFDRLIDGAGSAAQVSNDAIGETSAELAILISCVGRKMVLGQRIEEEVEAVQDVLGRGSVLTGFYSYGEISPFAPNAFCELHNQTMTITTLAEV